MAAILVTWSLLGLAHGGIAMFFAAAIGLLFLLYTGSTRELAGTYGGTTRAMSQYGPGARELASDLDHG